MDINNNCLFCNSPIEKEGFFCQKCLSYKFKHVETCRAISVTVVYRAFTVFGSTLEVSEDLEINENLSIISLENSLAFANGYKSVIIKNIERKNIENE
jgi:hypothetical protein